MEWIDEAKNGNITSVRAQVTPLAKWNVQDMTITELAKSARINDQMIMGIEAI